MDITFVGEVTQVIKHGENRYSSGIEYKTSNETYGSSTTVYVKERLELGEKVFVNFRTENHSLQVPEPLPLTDDLLAIVKSAEEKATISLDNDIPF